MDSRIKWYSAGVTPAAAVAILIALMLIPIYNLGLRGPGIGKFKQVALSQIPLGTPAIPFSVWIKDHCKDDADEAAHRTPFSSDCDLYSGSWIYDERYPLWNPTECPLVTKDIKCLTPGREDWGRKNFEFRSFRWQPHECILPRFNASEFRERMRNRRLAFVGDSLGNNQWFSMVGMAAVGANLSRVSTEAPPMSTFSLRKNRTPLAPSQLVFFEEHNFTIEFFNTKNLIFNTGPPKEAPPEVKQVLKLDMLHWHWIGSVANADVAVFNAGHWFTAAHTYNIGHYPEVNGTIFQNMSMEEMLRISLTTLGEWADTVDRRDKRFFFRTFAPVHERNECPSDRPRTYPNLTSESPFLQISKDVLGNMQHPMTLLDITRLSDLRPDGHIGPTGDRGIDCSHWCTPGVPDTWNELLYAELMRPEKTKTGRKGRSR